MIDYQEKWKTNYIKYYISKLRRTETSNQVETQKKKKDLKESMLLLQNNAPVQTIQVTIAEAANCGFELPPQIPYSPNFAPSKFLQFS